MSVTVANVRCAWLAVFAVILASPNVGVATTWWPATASPDGTTAVSSPRPPRARGADATTEMRRWLAFALDPNGSGLPFSFSYDGHSSRDLLPAWSADSASRRLGRRRTRHTLTWHDPATGLIVRCVAVEYARFPTVEWSLEFENAGAADTPILEDIDALDVGVMRSAGTEFLLHHNAGSPYGTAPGW